MCGAESSHVLVWGHLEPWQLTFSRNCWLLLLCTSHGSRVTFHVEFAPSLRPLTRIYPGMLPHGTTDITSATHAITSFLLHLLNLSCLVSYTTVHRSTLTSARSMPTAVLDYRNMQQKEIGLPSPRRTVSLLALASVPFLSVPLLSHFLFLFPLPARECAACSVLSLLFSPSWPFLAKTFFPYMEKY